jgi:hypothetical protein
MDYTLYPTDELAGIFSDYHKDVHGVRPRWVDHTDRGALIAGLTALDEYMCWMRSTPEGRAELREQGWRVEW